MLHEDQPLSTAIYKAEGNHTRESQQHFSEEKEDARDPDADVEVRQDFSSIMGNYTYRKDVAARTKLYLKDDFPMPLGLLDVQ